jgi:ABC-type multidrug transport system fused ATPase/permease subunit
MIGLLSLLLPYWYRILAGFLILAIVDLGQLVIPIFIKNAVDDMYLGKFSEVPKWALYILLVSLAFSVLRFFWRYFFIGTSRLIERDLREKIYQTHPKTSPPLLQLPKNRRCFGFIHERPSGGEYGFGYRARGNLRFRNLYFIFNSGDAHNFSEANLYGDNSPSPFGGFDVLLG